MASKTNSACVQCAKVPRFAVQDAVRTAHMDVSQDGCRLALSGWNDNTNDTFIDQFALQEDPGFQDLSLLMTSRPYFSREFTKIEGSIWRPRFVCLLEDSVFVTCCDDTIESYDTKHGRLVNRRQFIGEAICMTTTRDGRVYVGLWRSNEVIVFDRRLRKINEIKLERLRGEEDYPQDMTVNNNKLFIITGLYWRALMCKNRGNIENEFKAPNQQYRRAISITVSEENGLIYILWRDYSWGKCVVVYSLPGGHFSLPGGYYSLSVGHSSLSGCHFLASFYVSDDSLKTRVNNNVNRLFVVTRKTGEVYEYDTNDIINRENLLTLIELLITKDDCQKLLNYFKVPAEEAKTIQKSYRPSKSLLQHLRETGRISAVDISLLLTACNEQGISKVTEAWTSYQKYVSHQKVPLLHLRQSEDQRQQLSENLTESESGRQRLNERLKETQLEKEQVAKRLAAAGEEREQELEETKSNLRAAKDDLIQAQVKYAKESMVLQEVLQQIKEALAKRAVTSKDSIEQVGILPKENETSNMSQELTALAADFGRLMVDVAEDLTLDNTLKLAFLFELPDSEKDMLRRISLIETPGITLVKFLKTRNIINMFDVTNLQKGLMRLHLHRTNTNYVVPYQQKIDPFQFEENRSPDLGDWPDEKTESPKARKTSDSQGSERAEEVVESQNDPSEESLTEKIGGEEKPRPRQDSQNLPIREPYIEHKVNYEGGTITLMGVSLSIPENALSGDLVIALTVICDPDVLLPGTPQRGRMTPLVKLEPEGLKLNKPARLTIPHSAIIPEPDRHSVIIFAGQTAQGESQKGHITWTKENSVEWRLEQEAICLAINTLSYVFVNLVSHKMEQKHMFRVVPFIDGVQDVKDDVLITVCFCKDNDAQYQLLLDDYKSKLILGSYMTFQVSHTLSEDNDGVFDLALTMSPQIDSYCLTKGEATKLVDIDHLCAASRVSIQFRLKRSKERFGEIIDVKLGVSQGEKNKIALILQSKVKNILLSRETQDTLNRELTKDLRQYRDLKMTLSNLLEREHCEKLATVFELTPAERDAILNDPKPGMQLVKILDERELIMPDKVFGLYQGLQACHLNKIGWHVLDYIDATKKEKVNDSKMDQENNREANEKDLREKDFRLSLNARTLTNEGYKRLDVQRALKLSHGKLDLGRRILLLAKGEHERLPLLPGSNVCKEQYIDGLGGEMTIAGIHLLVPAGALRSERIVSLSISCESGIEGPISNRSLRLTPFVSFGPKNLVLHKHVIMTIPHCAFITRNQTSLDVYYGIPQKDKKIKWSLERKYFSCSMNSNSLQVELHRPCSLIGPHIPFQQKMRKNICVIPIMKRTSNPMDNLTISLWFYNDYSLELDCLVHEEVYNNKGIVLHDPVSFQVKTMGSILPVNISSSTSQWIITPKKFEVDVNSFWLLNRHKVTFHLYTEGNTDNVDLDIESRYGVSRKILFQLNIHFKVEDMYRFEPAKSPFQELVPNLTVKSFTELLKKLSENLDAEQSVQLANIFQLPEDVISSIEKHRKPGNLLMEMLTEKYVISASNVSRLEYALTETGNEQCAKLVRDFRRFNPVVHATMYPGDDNRRH